MVIKYKNLKLFRVCGVMYRADA